MIRDTERQTYEEVWTVPAYRQYSPGAAEVDRFLAMSGATGGSVLDAGCGAGAGGQALAALGFRVVLTDVTHAGLGPTPPDLPFVPAVLWDDLRPVAQATTGMTHFDYVYCCDVLEHVPTAFTMLVVARLLAVASRGVFLSVATTPDAFGAWVGTPLHQTVQEFTWWRDALAELGRLVEARDVLVGGLFYLEPRP